MAILENHFYHQGIRRYVVMFGTIFNDMKILRTDANSTTTQLVKVPICTELQDKQMIRRQLENPNDARYQIQLPRMTYSLTGFERDPTRQHDKNHVITLKSYDGKGNPLPTAKRQYNRVPYNFMFDLNIKTKYYDDMLQLIEQIVVWFSDNIELTVKDNPDLNVESTISLSLLSTSPNNDYEGIMDTGNSIETTLNFLVEGWLYKPTSASGLITQVIINYFDLDTLSKIDEDYVPEINQP